MTFTLLITVSSIGISSVSTSLFGTRIVAGVPASLPPAVGFEVLQTEQMSRLMSFGNSHPLQIHSDVNPVDSDMMLVFVFVFALAMFLGEFFGLEVLMMITRFFFRISIKSSSESLRA